MLALLGDNSNPAATSRLAYVECQAAFARGNREGRLSRRELIVATQTLEERWRDLVIVEIDAALVRRAGRIVHEHALRAGDAVHLASAETLVEEGSDMPAFACWDARLWDAASHLSFRMEPNARPS